MKSWMVWRYLSDGRKYLSLTFLLAVFGIALGVAALVIAMAVVSGYESTLRDSVINAQGHLMVLKRGGVEGERDSLIEKVKSIAPEIESITPFAVVEGLIAHKKKISGVVIEGVESKSIAQVINYRRVLTAGEIRFGENDEAVPYALIGKGIAKKYSISVGDVFRLVIPISRSKTNEGFRPKVQKFIVAGILDLGRTDYDERVIVTDLKTTQKFGELGDKLSGWRVRLKDFNLADKVARRIESQMGFPIWTRSWVDANHNLFRAVKYERVVIFFIVLVMVIAAAFNVASVLFLSVVRRYSQISILKALGADSRFIYSLFTRQGLLIGLLGTIMGLFLGLGGCQVFLWAQKKWGLLPGEVYKLDHVRLEVRSLDLVLILLSTLLICYLATLAPARRGAKLSPIEGLRYE